MSGLFECNPGSKLSLISSWEVRFEGILYTIDRKDETICLQSVRFCGTEGRKMPDIPASNKVNYGFLVFRVKDVKDLTVVESHNVVSDPVNVQREPPRIYYG